MQCDWNGYTLEVRGDWTGRWAFLAPEYELWLNDQQLDTGGGPRVSPELEAIFEDTDGDLHHIKASIISIAGIRPRCEITVEGEAVATGRVPVKNILNPLLIMTIIASIAAMVYVGPDVLRDILPMIRS